MAEIHSPRIELSGPLPADVEAGAEFTLGVRLTCPSGCALSVESVQALAPDGSVVDAEPAWPEGHEVAEPANPQRATADTWDAASSEAEATAGTDAEHPVRAEEALSEAAGLGEVSIEAPVPDEAVAEEAMSEKAVPEESVFSLIAPTEVGAHTWTIVLPAHEIDGVVHAEVSLEVGTTVRPHETSVAAWDITSPVVVGQPLSAKVGIRCSAECRMTGKRFAVRNDAGSPVGEGTLGDDVWPGTKALYWAEVLLEAPPTVGSFNWSAGLLAADLGSSHVEAFSVLSFRTVEPPEHTVSVEVVRDDTGDPIEKVEVRMGVYRASTDERGVARFEVPSGEFDVLAWKTGFVSDPANVEVIEDLEIRIEARYVPPADPDDERVWM